jgi:hypothetical protein
MTRNAPHAWATDLVSLMTPETVKRFEALFGIINERLQKSIGRDAAPFHRKGRRQTVLVPVSPRELISGARPGIAGRLYFARAARLWSRHGSYRRFGCFLFSLHRFQKIFLNPMK